MKLAETAFFFDEELRTYKIVISTKPGTATFYNRDPSKLIDAAKEYLITHTIPSCKA